MTDTVQGAIDYDAINKVIEDICDQKLKIKATQDYIKEATEGLVEKHDIPKKQINDLIKIRFADNAADVFSNNEETEVLYDKVFPRKEF